MPPEFYRDSLLMRPDRTSNAVFQRISRKCFVCQVSPRDFRAAKSMLFSHLFFDFDILFGCGVHVEHHDLYRAMPQEHQL